MARVEGLDLGDNDRSMGFSITGSQRSEKMKCEKAVPEERWKGRGERDKCDGRKYKINK